MQAFEWTNPRRVDLGQPYIYYIKVKAPGNEYRYVGKGSGSSRMDAYWKNVKKVLGGKPKRPAVKRDGSPQSEGNQKFRFVHLILAVAVKNGWKIQLYPLENVEKSLHSKRESELKRELNCNMNDQRTWWVKDFRSLEKTIK